MEIMKRFFSAVMAFSILVISCSKDVDIDDNSVDQPPVWSYSAGVTTESSTHTKTSIDFNGAVTWSVGDELAMSDSDGEAFSLSADFDGGSNAYFEGVLTNGAPATIYAIYPYSIVESGVVSGSSYTFTQPTEVSHGSAVNEAGIGDYIYMYGVSDAEVSSESADFSMTMNHAMAQIDFSLSGNLAVEGDITELVITSDKPLAASATFDMTNDTFTTAGELSELKVSVADGVSQSGGYLYVPILPQTIAQGTVWTIKVKAGDSYYSINMTWNSEQVIAPGYRVRSLSSSTTDTSIALPLGTFTKEPTIVITHTASGAKYEEEENRYYIDYGETSQCIKLAATIDGDDITFGSSDTEYSCSQIYNEEGESINSMIYINASGKIQWKDAEAGVYENLSTYVKFNNTDKQYYVALPFSIEIVAEATPLEDGITYADSATTFYTQYTTHTTGAITSYTIDGVTESDLTGATILETLGDNNNSGYFSIDTATGAISSTMKGSAIPKGDYVLTVTINDEAYPVTITVADPEIVITYESVTDGVLTISSNRNVSQFSINGEVIEDALNNTAASDGFVYSAQTGSIYATTCDDVPLEENAAFPTQASGKIQKNNVTLSAGTYSDTYITILCDSDADWSLVVPLNIDIVVQ